MSWLARSISNSLRIDDDNHFQPPHCRRKNPPEERERDDAEDDLRGVKDDLTEFRDSFTRQLLGVANFLAPPPPPTPSQFHLPRVNHESNRSEYYDPSISGNDYDDDKSLLFSRVSKGNDGNYSESFIKSSPSSLHQFGMQSFNENDDDDDFINEAVGLTDEVLTFAGNIAHHPETWLDFPVEDDEDTQDFPMSESQKRHAQAVECLTPRLAALRIELCPAHMSMGFFWKVYFVLLHSRLHKQDAVLLSTPEVVEARAKWMQEQQKRDKKESEWFHGGLCCRASDEDCTPRSLQNDHSETLSSWTFASEPTTSTTIDSDLEKHVCTDPQFMDKSLVDEKPLEESDSRHLFLAPISKKPVMSYVNNDDSESDEWPEDDCLDQSGTLIPVGITDEVSFSDLEDDDCCVPVISKP